MKAASVGFAFLALVTLGLVIVLTRSVGVYVAAASAFLGILYVYSLGTNTNRRNNFVAKGGSPYVLLLVIVLPLTISIGLFLLGRLGTLFNALIESVMIVGFSIAFFLAAFSIPLAIKQQGLEAKASVDSDYGPLVSILVPAYNEQDVISRTLESLVNLKYEKKEIIVIDDGSTDKTRAIASWYKKFGVIVLSKPNGGKASALNYGLVFAKGEIIITVDSDSMISRNSIDEVVKAMADPQVIAVSGNIRVLNNKSHLARLQELEYVVGINTMRRALALYGAVMVVPGAFGAFRKYAIENTGCYDKDTLTEDFDLTVKILKAYGSVGASSTATAFTEVPISWKALFKQRMRWSIGNYQTMFKHEDAFTNQRYGFLQRIVFPLLLLSTVLPFASFLVVGAGIYLALTGGSQVFLYLLALFFLVQLFVALLALSLDRGDYSLAWYSPLFVFGYKQFIDAISIAALLRVVFGAKKEWGKIDRVGGLPVPERKVPN